MNITIKFKNAEDAAKVDFTRMGVIDGRSIDGTVVSVDLDLEEWIDAAMQANPSRPAPLTLNIPVTIGIITATLAACGVWPESITS